MQFPRSATFILLTALSLPAHTTNASGRVTQPPVYRQGQRVLASRPTRPRDGRVSGIRRPEALSVNTNIVHSPRESPTMEEFFADAPIIRLDTVRHAVGLVPWSPSDLSATARFLYDETGLWMRFEVTDDVFHQPNTGPEIGKGDSILVALSMDGKTVAHAFGYALTPDGPRAFRFKGSGGAGTLNTQRHGNTLTYDIRIPWSSLAPLIGRAGETFRMDFMVTENDGQGRRGWLELTPGIGDGDDPSRWLKWTLNPG